MSCKDNNKQSNCNESKIYTHIGWTPVLVTEFYNGGYVIKVSDYIGGDGNKPAIGLYIGVSGYTIDISKANLIPIPKGDKGETGAQGPQGYQGVQGAIGSQGAQGAQGANGINGNQGVQGAQGVQGSQGVPGTAGSQGINGVQGPQGPQGSTGPQGSNGSNGTQGSTGAQGPQGTPANWTVMTQAQYNALPNKDPNTLYLITTT